MGERKKNSRGGKERKKRKEGKNIQKTDKILGEQRTKKVRKRITDDKGGKKEVEGVEAKKKR